MINELTRKNAHTELDHIFKTILPAHGMTERPEQIRLSHTMLDAMCENRIALSDAGTGIGKTYAYLTAAIVYSHSRLVDGLPFQPVIIATSSIALQNAIVREYLPFLATEDLMMEAVKRGGDRQQLHEIIRRHSMAATARMKEGLPCDLLDRLAADPAFGLTRQELDALMEPKRYIGRCPQQVAQFLAQCAPLLRQAQAADGDITV